MLVLVQAPTVGASLFAEQGSLAAGCSTSAGSSSGRACSVSAGGSSWRTVVREHRLVCVSQARRTWQARAKPQRQKEDEDDDVFFPEAEDIDRGERIDASRRRALLAALALTSFHFFPPQKDAQGLAVDDEKMKIELIQHELKKVLTRGKAAGVLRISFHDAGTFDSSDNSGGMNGSILFELDRPESAGLQRPIKVLQKVKRELDLAFPVSWADLIAVAGAAAVAECDGPIIPVKLGRLDSSGPDPEGKMPEETLSASALKKDFQSKGFTTQELVALSGAHTIGNKGFGNPNLFDNSYFQILLQQPWKISGPDDGMTSMIGLATDRALADDEECLKWLKVYAADQGRFFTDFAAAYDKLVNTGARWGSPLQA